MSQGYETVHLRPPEDGDLESRHGDFAAVRVGGAIDGYQVLENLAEGGMGAVFRVMDREGADEVALKTPLPGGRGGTYHHRMRRFLREARLTTRMDHEGVARVRENGQCDGLPYFTLDIVDGKPLSDRIYEEGVLPIIESLQITEGAARAAHHVHQKGVVHRDLKPANILIREDGLPVIIDFGLARDALGIDPRITESGIWLGTPAYISPEQALGEASRVDARADVYSLGAVLFELLTGLPPYGVGSPRSIFRALRRQDPKAPSELRSSIPSSVDRLVLKALARAPEDRFPNSEAFANAIEDVIEELRLDPPLDDDVESSALACSMSDYSDDYGETVACGWNEEPGITIGSDHSEIALEVIETPAAPEPRRKKSGRLRNSNKLRRSSKKVRAIRRGGKPKTARRRAIRRKDAGMEMFGRYLAFGGPAIVGLIGLLLIL